MRTFAYSIIGSMFVLWFQVVPNGNEFCGKNARQFDYHPKSAAGQAAGENAQAQFCKTVNS